MNLEAGKAPKTFDDDKALRQEFTKVSGDFITSKAAYDRLRAVEPTAAGDMALIFNYMKILDPESTVREGEYANAKNAGSWGDGMRNIYNKAKDGTLLEPRQRLDFNKQAKNVYEAALTQQRRIRSQYELIAISYGLDPAQTLIDFIQEGTDSLPAETLDAVGDLTTVDVMSEYNPETGTGTMARDDETGKIMVKIGGVLVPLNGSHTFNGVTTNYIDGEPELRGE